MLETVEIIKYWIDLSDYDLSAAKSMLKSGHFLYVGFMCHQTIEKALKAIIARDCAEGEIPPKSHNLIKLYEKAGLCDELSEKQIDFIDELNPLNIESRYPQYKENIIQILNIYSCKILLERTEELLYWIKKRLFPPQPATRTRL